jgi:type VII secretion protein EssB
VIENLCCTIKNSELNIPKEKRAFLTYQAPGLCPCTLEEQEDGIALHFEADGMVPVSSIKKKTHADKLRFLINIAELECRHKDYTFSLSPDNMMLDLNLRSHVLSRDLNCGGVTFMQKYMAIIAHTLAPKYSYTDYLDGGEDLYKKQKLLIALSELSTVSEIKTHLETEHTNVLQKVAKTRKVVPKVNAITARIIIPTLTAALLAAAFFAVYAFFFEIPHQEQLVIASQAYIAGDYVGAQVALRDVPPAELTFETKHFLSRAYVTTQAMTDAQKAHILMGLTRMTDETLFDFWIYLGRLEFESATDIAHRFADSELLLWVYLKQVEFVRIDTTIPVDERTALVNRLESEISRLQNERDVEDDE